MKLKNIPAKIYLQIEGAEEGDDFDSLHHVSWCADRINDSDIEYSFPVEATDPTGEGLQGNLWAAQERIKALEQARLKLQIIIESLFEDIILGDMKGIEKRKKDYHATPASLT